MGRGAQAPIPQIDRHSLRQLETHFVAPDIYRRGDLALRQSQLAQMVADRVIPQLLRLHDEIVPEAPSVEAVLSVLGPNRGDIAGLADIVLGDDLEAAVRYVIVLRDRGLSMETLFIELLEPTARHLGEMWDNDACDFIGVTLGVARLQKLLAAFNDTHVCDALDMRRTVLMAMTPGDQHFFGVTMVERFLEASGWKVQTETAACAEEIADAARTRWFAVAGLTAGSTQMIDSLSETIALIRKRSQNPHIGIMVGGPLFAEDPSLVAAVGADATAPSAPTAVLVAQKLSDAASAHLN
ncbi:MULTISPECIES: cobalamin B12-binding domain-containing protein [unclassified Blastomonas]|jgi:methanogenic corrinoid protein MtbC1|uniref:cobalamin B12-binding domain-containing protein n=3 Tax=Pseudomonadota TaxID=1224 RepID=UPI00076AD49B|nr:MULTISPECIES: cobalamin B12-binding domain-containing protein [unclassified Blastomonas]MAF62893.1 coenzyme B12-binding protein [Blastomonas sp.]|tara:strand:- start:154292 stop:155182 length:891 start_codon:yes stop_codon:yes gene_type:complete